MRSNTRGSCIAALGNGVLLPAVIILVGLPPALLLLAAQLLEAPWLGFVGAPLAIIYGAAVFAGAGVIAAGRLMLPREAELLVATTVPDES
jgi:hypothetical protein